MTKAQEIKGAKNILELTGTLGQTLKVFMGIYGAKLPECEGFTTEAWMAAHGVHRPEKNGKKGNYTPASIRAGWHPSMSNGGSGCNEMQYFRNVKAVYVGLEGDMREKIYTLEEAKKALIDKRTAKHVTRYVRQSIGVSDWSAELILKGLMQSAHYEEHEKQEMDAAAEFEAAEAFYIVVDKKLSDNTWTREMKQIDRKLVRF